MGFLQHQRGKEANDIRIAARPRQDSLGQQLVDNGPRTATVRSTTPMRMLVLGHAQFRDVLHQNGEIAVKILRAVTERLRAATPLATG